jgi:ribonuclease E
VHTLEAARAIAIQPTTVLPQHEEQEEHEEETAEEPEEAEFEDDEEAEPEGAAAEFEPRPDVMQGEPRHGEQGDGGRRRRRRRRRGGGRHEGGEQPYEAGPRPEQPGAYVGQPEERGGEENLGYPRERPGEAFADSEHRRRRRGRRGGRRRRGRDGEPFREGEPFETMPSFEPELDSAVADFDRPPAQHRAYDELPASEQPPAPVQSRPDHAETPTAEPEAPPAQPEPAPIEAEPPRRRSTVRERAPFLFDGDPPAESVAPEATPPAPAPEPAASSATPEPAAQSPEAEPEASNQPRRTGWWSRRFAGGKG